MHESKLAAVFLLPSLAVCIFYFHEIWTTKLSEHQQAKTIVRQHYCEVFERYTHLTNTRTKEEAILQLGEEDWFVLVETNLLRNEKLKKLCWSQLDLLRSGSLLYQVLVELVSPPPSDNPVYARWIVNVVFVCFVLVCSLYFSVLKPIMLVLIRMCRRVRNLDCCFTRHSFDCCFARKFNRQNKNPSVVSITTTTTTTTFLSNAQPEADCSALSLPMSVKSDQDNPIDSYLLTSRRPFPASSVCSDPLN